MLKYTIQKLTRKFGLELKKFPDADISRRFHLIRNAGIDTIFDVGANAGQYGQTLRENGFKGRIYSFEPMSKPFKKLRSKSENDIQWKAYNFALGAEDGSSEINVSKNSYSSSLLEMLPSHSTSAPESEFISQEKITVKRLNEVYNDVDTDERCCYLKVDTQGYEQQVLLGGNVVIENFKLIQLEMSIVPMYSGEATFREMLDFMEDLGFGLVSLEPGFSDKRSGQLLQVDGVFANKDLLNDKSLIG